MIRSLKVVILVREIIPMEKRGPLYSQAKNFFQQMSTQLDLCFISLSQVALMTLGINLRAQKLNECLKLQ